MRWKGNCVLICSRKTISIVISKTRSRVFYWYLKDTIHMNIYDGMFTSERLSWRRWMDQWSRHNIIHPLPPHLTPQQHHTRTLPALRTSPASIITTVHPYSLPTVTAVLRSVLLLSFLYSRVLKYWILPRPYLDRTCETYQACPF